MRVQKIHANRRNTSKCSIETLKRKTQVAHEHECVIYIMIILKIYNNLHNNDNVNNANKVFSLYFSTMMSCLFSKVSTDHSAKVS